MARAGAIPCAAPGLPGLVLVFLLTLFQHHHAVAAEPCGVPPCPDTASEYAANGTAYLHDYDGLDRGGLVSAEVWFLRALEADPGCVAAHIGRSQVDMYSAYRPDGGFDKTLLSQAMKHAEDALALSSDNPAAHVQHGYVLLYQNRLDDALADADAAAAIGGKAAALHGEIALRRGEEDSARAFWEQAIEEADGYPGKQADAYDALGELAYGRGEFAAAANYFKDALAIRPKSAWEAMNYARALMMSGRTDKAIDIAERIMLRQDVEGAGKILAQAYLVKGINLMDGGDAPDAESCLLKSVDADPAQVAAYMNLGALYEKQGRLPELGALCDRALAADPDNGWAARTKAELAGGSGF